MEHSSGIIDAKMIYDYIMQLQDENYKLTLENKNLKCENEKLMECAENALIDAYIDMKNHVDVKKTAKWDIDYDGYYPYCTECKFEPRDHVLSHHGQLPEVCPKCGAYMKNYKEFERKEK